MKFFSPNIKQKNNKTMNQYLYLSLIPEALIASNLAPEEFGSYYATGTSHHNNAQAIFFEVEKNFESDYFPLSKIEELCQPHKDGSPHKSVYLSVYRVLEHIPLDALKSLYLTTSDGKTLKLDKGEFVPEDNVHLYLYQDLGPVKPRVASALNPAEYVKRLTSPDRLINTPKIAFCDLRLGNFEKHPDIAIEEDLPYANMEHLRDCLSQVNSKSGKNNKVVVRRMNGEILYRTVKNGFYVGDNNEMLFYPMPSREDLENKHFNWWRSALTAFGE